MSMLDWFEGFFVNETTQRKTLLSDSILESCFSETDNSVTIKEGYFNSKAIKEYPIKTKKFIYRPKSLEQYIGQDKAKSLVKLNIKKIKELRTVNFLLSGKKGGGKTTLAYIIKNLLNATLFEHIAGELSNPDQLENIINEISFNENGEPRPEDERVVLFLDEIHALSPKLCEIFYPIMEDYQIGGKAIKPFILIGATTEKNKLLEKVSPFVDRFQVQIDLENYTEEDIIKILRQYNQQIYLEKIVPDIKLTIIARNCKFTPRIAITLLEDCLIEENIGKVLSNHRIIKDGLTDIDFKLLKTLNDNDKPLGENALAQILGISQADYKQQYEPHLCEMGYILRTPRGRLISAEGKRILNG